jgi:histidine kinase
MANVNEMMHSIEESSDEGGPSTMSSSRIQFKRTLYGRQDELDILHAAFQRAIASKAEKPTSSKKKKNRSRATNADLGVSDEPEEGSSSAVFISGRPGTGKSALVNEFEKQTRSLASEGALRNQSSIRSCHFLYGKFNELDGGDPFSALTEAFDGFCREVIHSEDEQFRTISEAVNAALGSEGKLLLPIIPSLASLLSKEDEKSLTIMAHGESNWNRLVYCFKNLVRAICTKERPVIMFLDDLQWADEASIELLSDLLANDFLSNFMVLGAYRSDEVDSDHVLTERLSALQQSRRIDRIELHGLSRNDMTTFTADTLGTEVEDTSPLASVVWTKTDGNIFFSKQVLEDLCRKQLLRLEDSRWTWNMDEINLDVIVPQGVEQVVTSNIQSLPENHQKALALAAFMRFKFDIDTLLVVMQAAGVPTDADELSKMLELAVFRGLLLNSTGSHEYAFAHDRVKEAALALLTQDQDSYDETRLGIAMALLQRGKSEEGENWMLFIATDHLNTTTNHKLTPYELAKLNLFVGGKAVEVAAFAAASRYLNRGIESLSEVDSHWDKHYSKSARLYQAAADMEFCLGNFKRGTQLCKIIIQHAQSDEEKLLPYNSLADSLGRQGRYAESLATHIKALNLVGEFPKHFQMLFAGFNMGKVLRLLNKTSDYEFLLLPRMTDKHKLAIMDHLDLTVIRAYLCNNVSVALMAIQKSILLSFQHGISLHTARAFSSYGALLFGVLKNHSLGSRLTKLANDIVLATETPEAPKHKEIVCGVLTTNTVYVDLYTKAVTECMETLREAEKYGFESGDFESAFRASCTINVCAYVLGLSLHSIKENGTKLLRQLELYKVDSIQSLFNEHMMLVEEMTKKGQLSIDWASFDQDRVPSGGHDAFFINIWCYWARVQVAYYFGQYETAEKITKKFQAQGSVEQSFAVSTIRVFFAGLTYTAMARKTKQKQYLSLAKKALEEAKVITKKRGLNNVHRHDIMEADILSCNASAETSTVIFAFDKAIESAGKAGVLQDMALANELAGEFCLGRKNKFRATMYLSKAHRLYVEWGADAKVRQLKKLHGDHIQVIASSQGYVLGSGWETAVQKNGGKVEADCASDDGSYSPTLYSVNNDAFSTSQISKLTCPRTFDFLPKAPADCPSRSETCSISDNS